MRVSMVAPPEVATEIDNLGAPSTPSWTKWRGARPSA